jgi:uncharacterized oxidoreductase
MPTIPHDTIRKLAFDVYRKLGAPEDIARMVSDYQVDTNLYGHDSHGCLAIPRFVADIRSGKIVPDALPEVVREDGPTALIDGQRGFGHSSADTAVRLAIDKGRAHGIGAVGITNCNHVGALWGFVKVIVDAGMVGVVFCSAGPRGGSMVPFGGVEPVLAGNPIGFGVPGGEAPPLIADISTAMAAGGKVLIALQNNQKIPGDWVVDAEGNPTTDPEKFMTPDLQLVGAMRPFGQHKGYAIAMFAEVLGAILTGYGPAYRDEYIEGNGTFVLAIDIARFVDPNSFRQEVDGYFHAVKGVKPAKDVEEILIPGELELRSYAQRMRDGIPFPDGTWKTILDAAEDVGVIP